MKTFKQVTKEGWNYIRIFDEDNNTFLQYTVDSEHGFPFGNPYKTTFSDMGYHSVKEAFFTLKERNLLGEEISYKEQRESERNGLIELGVIRIKNHNRVSSTDFDDVIQKLAIYGMNYCDAYNVIVGNYEYEMGF